MAASTTPDGIVYPTLTDQGDDLPAVFATLAGSVQTALTNVKGTITSLSNTVTPTTGTVSPLNSYTIAATSMALKQSGMVILTVTATKTAGVDAVNVGSIPAALAPATAVTGFGVASQGGAATPCTIVINTDGTIRNWTAAAPNQNISFTIAWKAKP